MFIDTARIYVKAGDGGNGCQSFYRDRVTTFGKPDGGTGGDGASVHLVADKNVQTLLTFRYNKHFKGARGAHGGSSHKQGARGVDLFIPVPEGTLVYDANTGDLLRDLTSAGESVRVCAGGCGGKGNSKFREATPGGAGEEREIRLELKLIADVALVGFPNAGKSTFIARVSAARPKIASFPFSTREPSLGVVQRGERSFVIADVPGLIEGAHQGRGLGDTFLRHIERTKVLVKIVDLSGFERPDPFGDLQVLDEELRLYKEEVSRKPFLIVANKMDIPEAKEHLKQFKKKLKRRKVFAISAATGEGVAEVVQALGELLEKHA